VQVSAHASARRQGARQPHVALAHADLPAWRSRRCNPGPRKPRTLPHRDARDLQSLSEHAAFVAGNITFLLDASLGLINVEQNAIIKIFLDRLGRASCRRRSSRPSTA
jgi:hypothetical protein